MGRVPVKIAKATKTFGLKGEVILKLYDTFPDEIEKEEPIFALINGLSVPLFFSTFERRGNTKALVIFDDIDSETRARELVGVEFLAYEEQEEDDEIYYEDLEGYGFVDRGRGAKGTITGFVDNDLNPLFVAEYKGNEIFIPASDDLIEEIDTEEEIVYMTLPEGLLDLYLYT